MQSIFSRQTVSRFCFTISDMVSGDFPSQTPGVQWLELWWQDNLNSFPSCYQSLVLNIINHSTTVTRVTTPWLQPTCDRQLFLDPCVGPLRISHSLVRKKLVSSVADLSMKTLHQQPCLPPSPPPFPTNREKILAENIFGLDVYKTTVFDRTAG